MQKEFYFDNKPQCDMWDNMWTTHTIEQELEACDFESPPRDLFLRYLSKEDRIVDAGCGFGKWVIYLHRRGYNILGIDNNELAVTKLKEIDDTLQVEAGDILNIPYPDNSFGAYISMGVIEHFEEGPLAALKEAYRILKPGGLAIVSVPTVNMIRMIYRRPIRNAVNSLFGSLYILVSGWSKSKFGAFYAAAERLLPERMKRLLSTKENRYYHFAEYRYTKAELENFLTQAGFEIVETKPHDFYGSKNHAVGLWVDFPFLRVIRGTNFRVNILGRLISQMLDGISPWIACSSVICVGRSLKKSNPDE
jgi:SAM-dependent methyltransferase